MSTGAAPEGRPSGRASGRPPGRKFAETVTLALSALLVAGVAAFLVYQALRPDPPPVPLTVRVLADQARQTRGGYVVPVEVRNGGRRTLSQVKVLVRYHTPDGAPQTADFLIDYLPERSHQTVHLTLDRHPTEVRIEAAPFAYQLE